MKDLCRRIGITEATFYHWKAKYGGLEVSEIRRLRQPEEENGRLKKIVAQQALDLDALKMVLAKKWWAHGRSEKQRVVRKEAGLSERRACGLIGMHRGSWYESETKLRDHQRISHRGRGIEGKSQIATDGVKSENPQA